MSAVSKPSKCDVKSLKHSLTSLQSESKIVRKDALYEIYGNIFERKYSEDVDFPALFNLTYIHILKSFSDDSEGCREIAINVMSDFIEFLPLNDYYLTYIFPTLVRRIGSPEIVEESEEIRLLMIQLVHKIILKYKDTLLLNSFMNDFTNILAKTVTDPYPKVKTEACDCIVELTKASSRDFHYQCESYVKPTVSNFSHQHFRVRVAAIRAIGAIVMAGNAKCFEISLTPMAEKLFDENMNVRLQVTLEVGNWMLAYRDRYSFWHRMIPLLLTSLSDVMANIRETAMKLWNDIGIQFMEENEEDLKKKTDFLTDVPSHYPDVKRPNLGCRTLVQRNIGKIVPAIGKEMDGWQADARLRVAQLLCWLLLCAEEGATQHAAAVVRILLRGAGDDDARVVQEIKRASELFGYFITPETWWPLVEAEVDSWPALFVITNILKGSQGELVKQKVMKELCKEISHPGNCQTRKLKYQQNLLYVCEALMMLCKQSCMEVNKELFTVNYTVYAMAANQDIQYLASINLDSLRAIEDCRSLTELYDGHIGRVLASVTSDAITWDLLTPDRALLECVLTHSGAALSNHLHLIAPLLKECLATPKVDPEVKLKMFSNLSTVLAKRQTTFDKCDPEKLFAFLKIIIEEVILPNLIWSAGRTAEAIRTAAVACLCSAMQEEALDDSERAVDGSGDADKSDHKENKSVKVNLFSNKESVELFVERVAPLLATLVDDNSTLTRQHSLRAVRCLAALAHAHDCLPVDTLHKLCFVVLKRLDDPSDVVRSHAVRTLRALYARRPADYDVAVYSAHVDAVYSALLIHLDDADKTFRQEILDALIFLSIIDPKVLLKKIQQNIHLYRNKSAYENLTIHIEKIAII